jgi:hypothetical protein
MMPYVTKGMRDHYAPYLEPLTRWIREHGAMGGELNYLITSLMIATMEEDSGCLTYTKLQEVAGAATEAAAEFRRRVLAPFEAGKAKANGDLYEDLESRVRLSASTQRRSSSSG